MKKIAKLSAVLLPLAAACGGYGTSNTNARSVETECSLTLRQDATAAELKQAVNAVLDGSLDPCGGAVKDLRARNVALERIDHAIDVDNHSVFTLVFRVSGNEFGPYQPK